MQLEAEGFQVLLASSAEQALEIIDKQPVTLITLDLLLPKMGGWEFLEQLKTMPNHQRVPVVIMSVVADRDRGVALGAAAVLEKPVSRDQLYEALVELQLLPIGESKTLTVLIADDDRSAVEVIAVRMEGMASKVLRAYGGKEAIEIARRELPDLLVLDLMMPDVSGFDVVAALNETADTARIPIVVVTAAQLSPTERLRLTGYVTAIMEKSPFDNTRLMAEVRRAMIGRPVGA
jgi:CheY-like chemotaxis protein